MNVMGAIPVFVAVAETQGFAAASQKLGITKSAVSKRISALEADLGVRLFHRSTRSVTLTEAGAIFLEHAAQAEGAARDAEAAVTALQKQPTGQLRVNVPMSFGRLHIAPLIPGFLKAYPDIDVDLSMEDRVVDLIGDGFDLALRGGTLPDSALVARRLLPLKACLVASSDYLEAHGTPRQPEDLPSHATLHYTLSRDPQEWVLRSGKRVVHVKTKSRYRASNSEALREAALQGTGIARLPTFICGADLRSGRLIHVLPEYTPPEHSLYAVFPQRRHIPQKVRAFVDHIQGELGGDHPVWDHDLPT